MASENIPEEYDVIIIGGGISGLYTAWRLANATNLKVLVLEATSRFGGKFMTCQMPGGFNADLGAMRYSPDCHPILENFIDALDVNTETMNHVHGSDEKINGFKFFLRNKRLSSLEDVRQIYSIDESDLSHFLTVYRFYFTNQHDFDLARTEDNNFANSIFKPTGQKAKDMAVGQYLLHSNNSEIFNLSWSFYPPNNWQVAVADGKLGMITKYWSKVKTVDGGYETIIKSINSSLQRLGKTILKKEQKVETITGLDDGFTVRTTPSNTEYRCQKVIYASGEIGLRNISLERPHCCQRKITEMVNKTSCQPSFKLFLTYNRAWWEEYGIYEGITMTDLPLHCFITFGERGKSDSSATLLAAYAHNHASVELFQSLDLDTHERFSNLTGDVSEKMVPSRILVEHVHTHLKKIMGCPDLTEEPICAAKYFWGTGDYGGVSYYPKVGVDSNQLHWDSLKPFEDADIFITGDTFTSWDKKGSYIGFSEGVLLTSERILVNHFDLEPFIDGLCLQNPWIAK